MITVTSTGVNSSILEYTNNELYANILDAIHQFVITHGQTYADTTSAPQTAGAYSYNRAYKCLNVDGITYKQMVIGVYTLVYSGICVRTMENYDESTHLLTNPNAFPDLISYGHQRMSATALIAPQNGRLYLFANNRFYFHYHTGTGGSGSLIGSGGEGVFEIEPANIVDETPHHMQINSYLATGGFNATFQNICAPVRTFSQTGSAAAISNRMCTPAGAQGVTMNYMSIAISSKPSPLGTVIKHQVFDPTVLFDYVTTPYVKGKIYCFKVFTTNTGVVGDIFRVKCDSNYFLSTTGTDKDQFIMRHTTFGTFAVPL